MEDYILYFFRNDRCQRADVIRAESDELAIERAEKLAEQRSAQLWCGGRKLKVFKSG